MVLVSLPVINYESHPSVRFPMAEAVGCGAALRISAGGQVWAPSPPATR